jgi:hypothetical protein
LLPEEQFMRYRRDIAAICVVYGTMLGAASSGHAAELVIGSVLAVRGEVFRAGDAGQAPLAAKAPVHLGDTIVSGAGKAKIGLNDGSIVSIGENTRLRLSTYQSTSNDFTTRLSMLSGVLRAIVGRIVARGRFEIETETAIAAVRGTDWLVDVTSKGTAVAVVSGVVAVSSRGKPQTAVVLDTPGRGTDVAPGEEPHAPHAWPAQRFQTTLARASVE